MNQTRILAVCSAITLISALAADPVRADPLHAIAGGAWWHHDSGWVFPEKLGEFIRVGLPQDVAGSRDAVAYYAREFDGQRIVASVNVFPADSSAEATTLDSAKAALQLASAAHSGDVVESTLPLGQDGTLLATQIIVARESGDPLPRALYFVSRGEWRVRIVFTAARSKDEPIPGGLDFVRQQRWDTLPAS